MKVYIAGPMRGHVNFNFPAFDEAADRARVFGLEPMNPAALDRGVGLDETTANPVVDEKGHNETCTLEFMRGAAKRDFDAILQCDAVALLPGWETSKGARAEKAIADWIGLEVLDARDFLPINACRTCCLPKSSDYTDGTVEVARKFADGKL